MYHVWRGKQQGGFDILRGKIEEGEVVPELLRQCVDLLRTLQASVGASAGDAWLSYE